MPKLTKTAPKYRLHKASGQAVVTLAGKDHYLGKYDTVESHQLYDQLVGKWLAEGRPAKRPVAGEILVAELIVAYFEFAKQHYRRPDGTPTGTAERIKYPLRLLREHYGNVKVSEFGPLALKNLQQICIDRGNARSYINDHISRIKTCFNWGVSDELLDESICRRLASVPPLQKGKSAAKETDPIKTIDDRIVDRTISELHSVLADMVRFQRLTGARPREVFSMKLGEIDRSKECWVYQPCRHKNEHHGKDRLICIGPQAQAILEGYLDRESKDYVFTPEEGHEAHKRKLQKGRVTPPKKNGERSKKKAKSKSRFNPCYNKDSYRQAIHRACDRAFPPEGELQQRQGESIAKRDARLTKAQKVALKNWIKDHRWSPNRLRHTMATETRKEFGLEGVMATLGHSNVSTSIIYAERNCGLAAEIAMLHG